MMSEDTIFTEQQLNDWLAYERVRKGGRWNMFDPAARRAAKLGEDEYRFVMRNYSKLKEVSLVNWR